jgi:hypothetical protein
MVAHCIHANGGITPDYNDMCSLTEKPRSAQEILQECVDKTGKQPKKGDIYASPSFEASQLFGAAGLGTESPAATNGFSPSEMLGESTGLAATDSFENTKLFVMNDIPGRSLSAWAIAAIAGASVFVTAAGEAAVGYIWYVTRQDAEGLDGIHLKFAKP